MLAVIGVFVFLAISISVCGLVIGVVVQTVFTIVAPLVTLLGLAFGFSSMVGKLITSLISFFIKFIFAIIIFCACVLPYVGQAWQNLYRAFPDIVNNIGWHIENIRETLEEAINEGVNQHSQWLIYIWGLILVPIYYISNQIQNAARNNERNEDFAGDEYDGMGDRDDPPPYEENPSENHNVRNRVRPSAPPMPQGPGLYPDLRNLGNNDFHNEEANNNDNDIGNVYLNNNNMNRNQMDDNDERMCVICFSRERNVAVFPCGHTWLCEPCTNSVMSRNRLCPVCQTRIQEYRTIYI